MDGCNCLILANWYLLLSKIDWIALSGSTDHLSRSTNWQSLGAGWKNHWQG